MLVKLASGVVIVGALALVGASLAPADSSAVPRSASVCSQAQPFIQGTPGKSLLSILGVLRRPATVADAPPDLRATVAAKDLIFGQIFARYIRRARVVAGVSYYVMPGRSSACGTSVPGRLRGEYMVLWVGPRGYAAGTPAMIKDGGFFDQTLRLPSRSTIEMVVPDGVAAVTLHYPAGPIGGYDRHHAPAFTVTTKIAGNLMVVTVPRGDNRVMAPMTMTWRAANGQVIKRFSNTL